MSNYKEIAIIGPTASGKSALAIQMAHRHNAVILSIDSLAIYKKMDIVSAKPLSDEQEGIKHFGIDILNVDQPFNAQEVALLYEEASSYAKAHQKNLIIVGGSSFYLKSLLSGLSSLPDFSQKTLDKTQSLLHDLSSAYKFLQSIDPLSADTIDSNDRYRLEKLLLIYLETQMPPSDYFKKYPPKKIIKDLPIFNITVSRDILRERVSLRTKKMVENGLIDEIARLEAQYGRAYAPMRAIGVIETLSYLDNELTQNELARLITTHTMQLAKRQSTFNKTQFDHVLNADLENLPALIETAFAI